ncbi:hypothetical protein [Falsiroseomonas sp. HW251]|uniref:hypothetical protein n=1 Tax=Falsiroseomonas sp. HW251 TaxID=3390998 RepID=UPI003D32240E
MLVRALSRLRLDNRWMLNATKPVGNYGQMCERNVGQASTGSCSAGPMRRGTEPG